MNHQPLTKSQRYTLAVWSLSVLHAVGLDPATEVGAQGAARIVGRLELTPEELDAALDQADLATLHRTVPFDQDEPDEDGWLRLPLG
jgi:hypothetical protein